MLATIHDILSRCGTAQSVLPPTELFNEGWMLRLILDWFDKHREFDHPLSFKLGASWYSEALLPSRFLPLNRGDALAESFTHADGVIGHIDVQSGIRGDVAIQPNAQQFIVTEAKLGSALSVGTKNAPNFDQAARNVACMAYMLGDVGIRSSSIERLAFFVLAPQAQIASGVFGELVTKTSIRTKVKARVAAYGGRHDVWLSSVFEPTLERIDIGLLSWEQILQSLPNSDFSVALGEFYAKCLQFNPFRVRSAT